MFRQMDNVTSVIAMTLAEIAAAVGGQVRDGDSAAVVTAPVRFDSRQIEPGGLFVTLYQPESSGGHGGGSGICGAAVVKVIAVSPSGNLYVNWYIDIWYC
ncbi:hypothetical protein K1W54_32365 [Micromonospora sp. CPCC 205371]|nr:hypothetical protein [Micromonospora sp. CPCC 205371]